MKRAYVACAVIAVLLQATVASADEIRVLSSVGIKAVVDELVPQWTAEPTRALASKLAEHLSRFLERERIEQGRIGDGAGRSRGARAIAFCLIDQVLAQIAETKAG